MPGFSGISEDVIADAAFFIGLSPATVKKEFVPLPIEVDGLKTIALAIRAQHPSDPSKVILKPVVIIPHRKMLIRDLRSEPPRLITLADVAPLNVRHGRFIRSALANPETFFGEHWSDM